jgi:tRNA-specific 2-thiouridylase
MKVAIAMSGGVDSSVAAALLKEEGHQVTGVTMRIMPEDENTTRAEKDAASVARLLGIPHHIIDLRDIFARRIIDYFCREYQLGRTPNPCILCNKFIKFGALWDKTRELEADLLATGHHARIAKDETSGRFLLKKGRDRMKDQSYFLCQLTQEQLGHTLFPIGHLTKERVKRIAAERGFPANSRPESQEICFIPDDDHKKFLKEHVTRGTKPGKIRDETGNVLGQHQGIAGYTVGQRKGLGVFAARPLYVTAIEAASDTINVGTREKTYGSELIAENLNWIAIPRPSQPFKVKAKIRYRHPEAEAMVKPQDDYSVYVKFAEPQMAITPGQEVVFYDGDTIIGGGTISRRGR